MNTFSYARPIETTDAINEIVQIPGAKFIAGGTNLLDLLKQNIEKPTHLIDISHLGYKDVATTADGGIRLDALASNSRTAWNTDVELRYPLISQAILSGASPQLRNMATNAGNLLQRTRCYYFYDIAMPCNKREPGSGCSALKGINRIHAILGASEACIATHPSDLCVALAALDASVNTKSINGERQIDFADFHRLAGSTPHLDNNLKHGELITSIDVPQNNFAGNVHYLKIRDRQSYAFALVSVAAALVLEGKKIVDLRLALGGVAHKPWRDKTAEASVIGKIADEKTFQQLAYLVMEDAVGYGHNDFKIELGRRAIVQAFITVMKEYNN